ncbi:hypothetical protein [Haloferula sp.]|uniref:hypothetical protein n=1 Tax=Haloferula sp. TaxID=2497595 RepID=UPI003C747F5F
MKAIPPIVLTLVLTGIASAAPMKDRVTGEELSARRMASASPVSTLAQPTEEEPRVARPSNESIIKQSMILSDGTNWTLIPRGAVLHLPEAHQGKIGGRPVGNLLSWKQFVTVNRSWVSAEEITLRQAEGVQQLDDRRTAFWPKQDKIIVAVHLGGPISVVAPTKETDNTL